MPQSPIAITETTTTDLENKLNSNPKSSILSSRHRRTLFQPSSLPPSKRLRNQTKSRDRDLLFDIFGDDRALDDIEPLPPFHRTDSDRSKLTPDQFLCFARAAISNFKLTYAPFPHITLANNNSSSSSATSTDDNTHTTAITTATTSTASSSTLKPSTFSTRDHNQGTVRRSARLAKRNTLPNYKHVYPHSHSFGSSRRKRKSRRCRREEDETRHMHGVVQSAQSSLTPCKRRKSSSFIAVPVSVNEDINTCNGNNTRRNDEALSSFRHNKRVKTCKETTKQTICGRNVTKIADSLNCFRIECSQNQYNDPSEEIDPSNYLRTLAYVGLTQTESNPTPMCMSVLPTSPCLKNADKRHEKVNEDEVCVEVATGSRMNGKWPLDLVEGDTTRREWENKAQIVRADYEIDQ